MFHNFHRLFWLFLFVFYNSFLWRINLVSNIDKNNCFSIQERDIPAEITDEEAHIRLGTIYSNSALKR
jgi:hypothetical protein